MTHKVVPQTHFSSLSDGRNDFYSRRHAEEAESSLKEQGHKLARREADLAAMEDHLRSTIAARDALQDRLQLQVHMWTLAPKPLWLSAAWISNYIPHLSVGCDYLFIRQIPGFGTQLHLSE